MAENRNFGFTAVDLKFPFFAIVVKAFEVFVKESCTDAHLFVCVPESQIISIESIF